MNLHFFCSPLRKRNQQCPTKLLAYCQRNTAFLTHWSHCMPLAPLVFMCALCIRLVLCGICVLAMSVLCPFPVRCGVWLVPCVICVISPFAFSACESSDHSSEVADRRLQSFHTYPSLHDHYVVASYHAAHKSPALITTGRSDVQDLPLKVSR